MSKIGHRRQHRGRDTGAIQILEESFHLVRSTDLRSFWFFYLGAAPFALGLLYFVADMSRSSLAGRDAAFAALVMAMLYFWMHGCRARFCAGLWEALNPGGLPSRSRYGTFRNLSALCLIQAFRVPVVVIGLFFAIPLGWILAMFQNSSALALTQDLEEKPFRGLLGKSIRYSHWQWAQNHGILLVLFFVSFFTWINIIATALFVPAMGKSIFGIESIFTLSPKAAVMNTTFLFGSILLTQLVMGPLVHSAFVLRCFYASTRSTGVDLLSRLAECRKRREDAIRRESGAIVRVALVLLLLSGAGVSRGSAEDAARQTRISHTPSAATGCGPPPLRSGPDFPWTVCSHTALRKIRSAPSGDASSRRLPTKGYEKCGLAPAVANDVRGTASSGEVDGDRLREEIARTLEQKRYQWRLSRRVAVEERAEEKSWLALRLEEVAETAKRIFDAVEKWIDEMWRKMLERQMPGRDFDPEKGFRFFKEISSTASLALVVLILGLLLWFAYSVYRRYQTGEKEIAGDEGVSGAIDLESEDIVASQLPEDEWLRLAREQIAKGEERLAVRALFLATLAHLGERGLLRIARFKSNRDYRGELAMRARSHEALRRAFEENTTLFERAWYGLHHLGEGAVESFLRNHEAIAGGSAGIAPGASSSATAKYG